MLKKILISSILMISSSFAHTAVMTCFDNGDETITCEGGFSDGSTGKGVKMKVTQNDKIILEGRMNQDSEFTFKKPSSQYSVTFDAGKSHVVTINSKDIVE